MVGHWKCSPAQVNVFATKFIALTGYVFCRITGPNDQDDLVSELPCIFEVMHMHNTAILEGLQSLKIWYVWCRIMSDCNYNVIKLFDELEFKVGVNLFTCSVFEILIFFTFSAIVYLVILVNHAISFSQITGLYQELPPLSAPSYSSYRMIEYAMLFHFDTVVHQTAGHVVIQYFARGERRNWPLEVLIKAVVRIF